MEYPEKTSASASNAYPGTPRWVKMIGIIVAVLILLVVILHLTGHGMKHHKMPGNETQQEQQP